MKNFCYYFDFVISRIIPGILIALLFFPQGRNFLAFSFAVIYAVVFAATVYLSRVVDGRIYRANYCDHSRRFVIYPNGIVHSSVVVKFPLPSYSSSVSLLNLYNLYWYLMEGEQVFWHYPGRHTWKTNAYWRQQWEARIAKLKTKSKAEILANPDNLRDILFLVCPMENYQPYFLETLGVVGKTSSFELQKSSSESWVIDEASGAESGQSFKYLGLRPDFSVVESTKEKSLAELGATSEDIGIFEVRTTWQSDDWASHPSYGYYAQFQPM